MIEIGRFRETHNNDNLPSIFDAIQEDAPKYKARILRYLKNGFPAAMAPGHLIDKIDGKTIISTLAYYDDSVYRWRSDVIYYFQKYNIKLPDDFVEYVLRNNRY